MRNKIIIAIVLVILIILIDYSPKEEASLVQKWYWVETQYSDGQLIVPNEEFYLDFHSNSMVNIGTDCNHVSGQYIEDRGLLSFYDIIMTEMYCEGSQEAEFLKMIPEVVSYFVDKNNNLVLELKYDTGSMIFEQ